MDDDLIARLQSDFAGTAAEAIELAVAAGGPIVGALLTGINDTPDTALRRRLRDHLERAAFRPGGLNREAIHRLREALTDRVPLPPLDQDRVLRAFGDASQRLLGGPRDSGGHWIARPEEERLFTLIHQPDPALIALLGAPGAGKSALLATLGIRLQQTGALLLALKADQLPRDIASLDALDDWIGGPLPVAEALRRLARDHGRVVLLIDQLDALTEVMDQYSRRLEVLLRLVREVRHVPNLAVVLSCRPFEYRHDQRLRTLAPMEVSLSLPPWEQIQPLLGVRTEGWSDEVREMLRTPQHLSLFLRSSRGDAPPFTSYHAMLKALVDRLTPSARALAQDIAMEMAKEEQLSLGTLRFEARDAALRELEREDMLLVSEDRSRLQFSHQTLADFLRARAFLAENRSLADYVIAEKQESLFVRPTLSTALRFLRQSDRALYHREFGRLWTHQGLRKHLRFLLIALLGEVSDPDDQEAVWMRGVLAQPELRRRALASIAGSPGWFQRLQGDIAATITAPPEQAWQAVEILIRALPFADAEVRALVERHWLARDGYSAHVFRVLESIIVWPEAWLAIAGQVVERGDVAPIFAARLLMMVAQAQPAAAAALLSRALWGQLGRFEPPPPAETEQRDEEDGLAQAIRRLNREHDIHGPVEALLKTLDWREAVEVLTRDGPAALIQEVWPWFLEVLRRLEQADGGAMMRYRLIYGDAFEPPDVEADRSSLAQSLILAVRAFARADMEGFLSLVASNKHHDAMPVHNLLAAGLAEVAGEYPAVVLEYLLEDPRRFTVGTLRNVHGDTQRLIAAVLPALSAEDWLRLERAILTWDIYDHLREDDGKERRDTLRWRRQHRLRLLRAFPEQFLSQAGRRHRQTEERAFPYLRDTDIGPVECDWVGSPVSAEEMTLASDEDLIGLFDKFTDAVDSDHRQPLRRSGGSREVARAFEALAKKQPERALRLVHRLRPGDQERPVCAALQAFRETNALPGKQMVELVISLQARGFGSDEFVDEAAWCLGAAAEQGLDDAICDMLRGWLRDWQPPPPSPYWDQRRQAEEQTPQSLLWQGSRMVLVPGGNYPLLEALQAGYLGREPLALETWMALLEQHLERPENPDVWKHLTHRMGFLARLDRDRATAFLDRLAARYPEVRDSQAGALLVARHHGWLPEDSLDRLLDRWIAGDWRQGPQAAGEVAALRLCHRPDDPAAFQRLEGWLSRQTGEAAYRLRLGIAHTMAEAWRHSELRVLATDWLLRLLPQAGDAVADAIGRIFLHHPFPTDDSTRQLLSAIRQQPRVLAGAWSHAALDRLKESLGSGWQPDLIHALASSLIQQAGTAVADIRTRWAGDADDLIDIALTLHRITETRALGLDLFETLLEMQAFGVGDRLRDLDRPTFR